MEGNRILYNSLLFTFAGAEDWQAAMQVFRCRRLPAAACAARRCLCHPGQALQL